MAIHENDFEHAGVAHTMRIQVGFEPSDKLDAALQRFLLPDERTGRKLLFRSWLSKTLPMIDSTNDGVTYIPMHAARLARDRKNIAQINSQQIQIARLPEYRTLPNGDIELGVRVLAHEQQRRMLGGFVLDRWGIDEPLLVTTCLPHRMLLDEVDRKDAWRKLADDFSVSRSSDASDAYRKIPVPKEKQIYVSKPHLTERPLFDVAPHDHST